MEGSAGPLSGGNDIWAFGGLVKKWLGEIIQCEKSKVAIQSPTR